MICEFCREGGSIAKRFGDIAFVDRLHAKCPAVVKKERTHCDCQHKTRTKGTKG